MPKKIDPPPPLWSVVFFFQSWDPGARDGTFASVIAKVDPRCVCVFFLPKFLNEKTALGEQFGGFKSFEQWNKKGALLV